MRILVLSPHCDDAEISMGGTMARFVAEGNDVKLIALIVPIERVDGTEKENGKKMRIKEQKGSAKILGVDLEILDIPRNDFKFNRFYIKKLDAIVNSYNPDAVYSCWEEDTHQDHKTLANILYIASRKNNFSLYMYESTIPGGFNTKAFRAQKIVDISKYIGSKEASIISYKSVFGDEIDTYLEALRGRCRFRGERIGVKYAEGFRVVKEIVF